MRKLHLLHLYDCLRANKSMAAWGIEARVPFLDTRFLDVAMRIPARHKMVGQGGIAELTSQHSLEDVYFSLTRETAR